MTDVIHKTERSHRIRSCFRVCLSPVIGKPDSAEDTVELACLRSPELEALFDQAAEISARQQEEEMARHTRMELERARFAAD